MPEIVFPIFPALSGAVRNDDGTVSVDADWIVRLAEYKIKIEAAEINYREMQKFLEVVEE